MSLPDYTPRPAWSAWRLHDTSLDQPQHLPLIYATREEWLAAFTAALRPEFAQRGHPLGKVRSSIGFPVGGRNVLAECWADSVSKDATREIFATPACDDPSDMAFLVTHELCHAALSHGVGHGPAWAALAASFHMIHGPGGTYVGNNPEFKHWVAPILATLGRFPHAAMTIGRGGGGMDGWKPGVFGGSSGGTCGGFRIKPKATQTTRMIKCECGTCGYAVRTTRMWLDRAGAPLCPAGHGRMSDDNPDHWTHAA